jgi:hypothetical protein
VPTLHTELKVAIIIITIQTEVHKCKLEYCEVWKIHIKIVQITANQDAFWHPFALLNVSAVEVLMNVPKHDMQQNIDCVGSIFTAIGYSLSIVCCDITPLLKLCVSVCPKPF